MGIYCSFFIFKRGMDIYATWETSALDFEAFFSLRPGFNMSQLWHRRLDCFPTNCSQRRRIQVQ